MLPPEPIAAYESLPVEVLLARPQLERRRRAAVTARTRTTGPPAHDPVVDPWSYLAKLGRGVLRLGPVEFRILRLLAAHPYRPFSRDQIAAEASTEKEPITASAVGSHIRSLRRQLGFAANYIQRVPYLGYRFKP